MVDQAKDDGGHRGARHGCVDHGLVAQEAGAGSGVEDEIPSEAHLCFLMPLRVTCAEVSRRFISSGREVGYNIFCFQDLN